MNVASGVVEKVWANQVGKGTAYNIVLQGGAKYGHGFKAPIFAEGDYIEFTYTENGRYKNMDAASVQIKENASTTSHAERPKPSPAPAPSGGGNGREKYWEDKAKADVERQKEIRFQASRNQAIEVAKIALEHGALSLGQTKAKKLDILVDYIEHQAKVFANNTEAFVTGKPVTEIEPTVEGDFDQYDD